MFNKNFNLKIQKWSEIKNDLIEPESKCSICFDFYKDNTDIIQTKCKHVFCCKCLEIWLNNNNSCPLCRKEILYNNDLDNLYNDFINNLSFIHQEYEEYDEYDKEYDEYISEDEYDNSREIDYPEEEFRNDALRYEQLYFYDDL